MWFLSPDIQASKGSEVFCIRRRRPILPRPVIFQPAKYADLLTRMTEAGLRDNLLVFVPAAEKTAKYWTLPRADVYPKGKYDAQSSFESLFTPILYIILCVEELSNGKLVEVVGFYPYRSSEVHHFLGHRRILCTIGLHEEDCIDWVL